MLADLGVAPQAKDEHLLCRALLHAWEPCAPVMEHRTLDMTLFLVCTRCGTEKAMDLNPDGSLYRAYYDRPAAYQGFLRDVSGMSRADMRRELEHRQQKRLKAGRK